MSTVALQDEWLVVRIGKETFVINANHVRELIQRQKVQGANLTDDGTEGIILHRGKALCVVNGVIKLNLEYPHEKALTEGFFVVFDLGTQSYALAVTELIDVMALDESRVSGYAWTRNPAITSVVRHQELGLLIMLDPLKLIED